MEPYLAVYYLLRLLGVLHTIVVGDMLT